MARHVAGRADGVGFVFSRGGLPCVGTERRRSLHGVPEENGRHAEVEAYHDGRYFALTGARVWVGDGRARRVPMLWFAVRNGAAQCTQCHQALVIRMSPGRAG